MISKEQHELIEAIIKEVITPQAARIKDVVANLCTTNARNIQMDVIRIKAELDVYLLLAEALGAASRDEHRNHEARLKDIERALRVNERKR